MELEGIKTFHEETMRKLVAEQGMTGMSGVLPLNVQLRPSRF